MVKLGVSVKGKIALIRYGRIFRFSFKISKYFENETFRGDKIRAAQQHEASAAIIFSDPEGKIKYLLKILEFFCIIDCAPDGTEDEHVYPNTDYMPSHGVQRGSLKEMDGDPLSPFYPARKDLYSKLTIEDVRV